MNKERLLKLADHLDTVPDDEFDYTVWQCGTKACALGHAALMPEFQELGLRVSLVPGSPEGFVHMSDFNVSEADIFYRAESSFSAAETFFELSRNQAEAIFTPIQDAEYDATAREVAAKIRQIVKDTQ